jgi:hypothetical protein
MKESLVITILLKVPKKVKKRFIILAHGLFYSPDLINQVDRGPRYEII